MTFVRPQRRPDPVQKSKLAASLGLIDDQDGRASEAFSDALKYLCRDWIAVIAVRVALMTFFLGGGYLAMTMGANPTRLAGGLWLLTDIGVVGAAATGWFDGAASNKRLAIGAVLAFLSAATFTCFAALALESHVAALLLAVIGSALLGLAVLGRMRAMGLGYALGTCVSQLAILPGPFLVLPNTFLLIALTVLMLRERRATNIRTQSDADNGSLNGEQAKALLEDFEKAGRGWFWETDRSGNITYVSERLAAQLGSTSKDLIGTPFSALLAPPAAGDVQSEQRTINFHFSAKTAFSDIMVRGATDQEERFWSISGQPQITSYGQFLGFRGSGSDLTEMRRSQAEVARLASVDSLTGLANRSQMILTIEQSLNAQRGLVGEAALFLLDLDRFKEVNDTMGHPAGDALLRQVAQRLLRIVGTAGKVGRLGGDEFQIVLPGIVEVMALAKLADNIIHALSEPYLIESCQVVIGVSIGIALAPADGSDSDTLIRNADLALYAAKGEGRGQFRFFIPAMHAEAEDKRQLEVDLRQAISTGGLHLHYQPVVCACSERITGFEALIRWDHPMRGAISPSVFIPIAEDAGLISAIGEWVMRTACTDAAKWPDGTRVAVNVSPIQFANASLPNMVMSALANSGLEPSRLELEITESVFLSDQDNTDSMFAHLKNIGVRLALDDFGTGYSALGYLKTAPFDKIKIDQSFVRGAAIKGSRNSAIVKSIVNLAEALGMETTAEGAETLDELDLIRSLGCSHIQGYVYGRPIDFEATFEILARNEGHAIASGHKSSREPRRSMLRTVTLHHGSNRYTARVRNISASGAMVEGLIDVPAGTAFRMEFGPTTFINGKCRWSRDDRMGIEFDVAVNVEQLSAIEKPVASMVPVPAPSPAAARKRA